MPIGDGWHFTGESIAMRLTISNFLGALSLFLLTVDIGVEGTVGPLGMKSTSFSALLIVAWSTMFRAGSCANSEVEQHLELGKKLLAAGQLSDALSHYHAAVEGDPTNYMTYYRRATVYLALGKSRSALPDLDKVIELKPDFLSARMQRANVKLKQGQLDEAEVDYKSVLEKEASNEEAKRHVDEIETLRVSINTARNLYENHDYFGTINHLENVIEISPWDPELRELRAACYEAVGDFYKAISDIRPTTKLRSDNTEAYFRISTLLYKLGDAEQSLNDIRECLKLDPDHKDCFPHYKKVKKLSKQINSVLDLINEQRWEDCLGKVDSMLTTEPDEPAFVSRAKAHKCHCYSQAKMPAEAIKMCDEVIESEPNNIQALCDRADAHIDNENFEEAVEDFKKAEEIDSNNRRAQEGSKRAQKLLKQSQKRDYYKILGVKRTANTRQITKAYRKLAAEWHPDKYSGDDKEKAEKKFIDIAAAKEVLTDPEKRQKFDNGEDPLDPEEQASGNPWQQGFNPFGNSGFQFKFHFN